MKLLVYFFFILSLSKVFRNSVFFSGCHFGLVEFHFLIDLSNEIGLWNTNDVLMSAWPSE